MELIQEKQTTPNYFQNQKPCFNHTISLFKTCFYRIYQKPYKLLKQSISMRSIKNRNILDEFALSFSKIVEKYTEYIIVSGFVAISSGRTRGTEDIDMILKPISEEQFFLLHKELINNKFVCMQSDDPKEIFSYLKENLSVRYTKKNQSLPEMEIKFAQDELDLYQLKTKTKLELTGLDLYFSSIDMNVAFKEEYLKSEKDLEDAIHLRKVYSELIDEKEIQFIKEKIKKLRLNK